MGIFPFLLTASIAAAPLAPTSPAVMEVRESQPRPALWVANDDDTIIYLFGTFHALDGTTNWFDQSVKTAFSASDEVILETLVPRPTTVPARRINGKGHLSPPKVHTPSPIAELAPSSFLGTTKMVMNAGRAKGLSTDHGADAILRDAAEEAGKFVGGLESFEFQLQMFSALPSPQMSGQDPRVSQALGTILDKLQTAWSRGEIETFAPMLRQMQAQSPQTYNTMFVERNTRWAHWIADRMNQPGTVFVAVGAGHLAGPDSVQNNLATLGVKSARIN